MKPITAARALARHATATALNAPLPVIDIATHLMICARILSAARASTLPRALAAHAPDATLTTDYAEWQTAIWEQFYLSLLNAGVMAQAQAINTLVGLSVSEQQVYQNLINPSGGPTPTIIALCDGVAKQINAGTIYTQRLRTLVERINGANENQLATIAQVVSTLNLQFETLHETLIGPPSGSSTNSVISVILIRVVMASDSDSVEPLMQGIARIDSGVTDAVVLTAEIQHTVQHLRTLWSELDEITRQVAQLRLMLTRLNAIVAESSACMTALSALAADWQRISDVITGSTASWDSNGYHRVADWASRMTRIEMPTPVMQWVVEV